MKRLNALVLAGLLALPFAATAQAQQPTEHPRPRAQAEMGRRGRPDMAGRMIAMRSELKLSDEQVARLTDLQRTYREKNVPIMQSFRGARPDSGIARRHPRFNRDSLKALTPDQRKEMRKDMQARREAYLKAHPEVREAQKQMRENMQSMRKDVNAVLTPDQRDQLKQHFEQQRTSHQHDKQS